MSYGGASRQSSQWQSHFKSSAALCWGVECWTGGVGVGVEVECAGGAWGTGVGGASLAGDATVATSLDGSATR